MQICRTKSRRSGLGTTASPMPNGRLHLCKQRWTMSPMMSKHARRLYFAGRMTGGGEIGRMSAVLGGIGVRRYFADDGVLFQPGFLHICCAPIDLLPGFCLLEIPRTDCAKSTSKHAPLQPARKVLQSGEGEEQAAPSHDKFRTPGKAVLPDRPARPLGPLQPEPGASRKERMSRGASG